MVLFNRFLWFGLLVQNNPVTISGSLNPSEWTIVFKMQGIHE